MSKEYPEPMEELDFPTLFGGRKIAEEVTEEIHDRLFETIYGYLRRRSVITLQDLDSAGMPNVTLRLATIQLIFEGLREAIHGFSEHLLLSLRGLEGLTPQQEFQLISSVFFRQAPGGEGDYSEITAVEAQERLNILRKNLEDPVDRGPYREALFKVGQKVGWSFSLDLLRYARKELNEIPLSYRDLLRYWAVFDSATDLAREISVGNVDLEQGTIDVVVRDSFLRKGNSLDAHKHCAFMEGYILGVLDGLFISWVHWLRFGPFRLPEKIVRVARISEEPADHCHFIITVEEAADSRVANRLADAVLKLEEGDLKATILESRTALEEAARVGMGLPEAAKIKYSGFIDVSVAAGVPLNRDEYRHLYGRLSTIIHGETNKITTGLVRGLLTEVWLLTREFRSAFGVEFQSRVNNSRKRWLISSGTKD